MGSEFVISAYGGIFPGADSPEQFWDAILAARVAPQQSLESIWSVPREKYYSENPGVTDKTYLDVGHCLSIPFVKPTKNDWRLSGENRQIQCGTQVLNQLLSGLSGQRPAPERTAFLLGTSWSDASYFGDDIRATMMNIVPTHPSNSPSQQLAHLASVAGAQGPRLAVDTACASSMYALATALDMLRSGSIDAAFVMGLNAYLPPFLYIGFSKIQALSTTGKCLPFSSEACGIIPSEAAAALFVETEEHARKCGRTPLARIASFGLSADGGERSVFAPGPEGQKLAYSRAYQHINSNEVDYIETHGTGTPLGDETEATCLHEFFNGRGREKGTLPIGSVKSLIGHSLAAAGCCSLIKAILILKNRTLPPHIAVTPMERIHGSCLRLDTNPQPLVADGRLARVGVTSLGFGGANAHVVLEEYAEQKPVSLVRTVQKRVAITGCHFFFGDKENGSEILAQTKLNADAGSFELLGSHSFDITALRMGPAQAARLDPFILLLAHVANGAFSDLPETCGPDETAVVASNDLGSEASFVLGRKYMLDFFEGMSDEEKNKIKRTWKFPELTVEGITSALPAMLSGLVAAGKRVRGFHQTVSASPVLLWDALSLSYNAICEERCKALVLSSGQRRSSPLISGNDKPVVEGALSLALCAEEKLRDGEPLLWVEGVFPGHKDTNEIARQIGESPQNIHPVRVDGDAVSAFDFGENAGILEFLEILLLPEEKIFAVSIAHSSISAPVFTILLRRTKRPYTPRQLQGDLCVETRFGTDRKEDSASSQSPGSRSDSLHPSEATSAPAFSSKTHSTHHVNNATHASSGIEALRIWNKSAADAAVATFEARSRVMASLFGAGNGAAEFDTTVEEQTISVSRQRKISNVVISEISQNRLEATLLVDETHPYFFDHPLDHVPGILLLEGAAQLGEVWLGMEEPASATKFVSRMDITFKRYVEKNGKIILKGSETREKQDGNEKTQSLFVTCLQDSLECCSIQTVYESANSVARNLQLQGENLDRLIDQPPPETLHKHRVENILVTRLVKVSDEQYRAYTLPLPGDHFFCDGPTEWYSPVYLLETGRQMMMQLAHDVFGLPLGLPMALIRLRLKNSVPISRTQILMLETRKSKVIEAPGSLIAEVEIQFVAGDREVGSIAITAQVSDPKMYAEQRNKR